MKHISQNLLLFDIMLFNIINERRTESAEFDPHKIELNWNELGKKKIERSKKKT